LVCGGWDNSLLGVFISLVGQQKFPACGAREFARQGLDSLDYFRGQTEDFRRKSTKFPAGREKGNLAPPGKRVGVRAQLA
jgi:hypothetical protein